MDSSLTWLGRILLSADRLAAKFTFRYNWVRILWSGYCTSGNKIRMEMNFFCGDGWDDCNFCPYAVSTLHLVLGSPLPAHVQSPQVFYVSALQFWRGLPRPLQKPSGSHYNAIVAESPLTVCESDLRDEYSINQLLLSFNWIAAVMQLCSWSSSLLIASDIRQDGEYWRELRG